MQAIIDFIILQLLSKPVIFLGFISFIGLALQKKKKNEIIEGVIKTIVGLTTLDIGAGVLTSALTPLMVELNNSLGVQGVIPANDAILGILMNDLAGGVVPIFILGFLLHLVLVKIIPINIFKNVYLTVHMMLFHSGFMYVALSAIFQVSNVVIIIISSLICAIYWTFSPAIARYYSRDWTGDAMSLSHGCQIGTFFANKIGKIVGNPDDDAENLELPKSLSMFRDFTVSLAFLMPVIFVGIGVAVGRDAITQLAGENNWILWLILEGIVYTAGILILLNGVRMFIASIVPAFTGISQKFLPSSVPALDCPVFYPYSPMGAMLGFISSIPAALIVTFLTIVLKSPVIVFPSAMLMFFHGSTMGVFANKSGGWKGALSAGFVLSLVSHAACVILYPMTGVLLGTGITFSDIDYAFFFIPLVWILKLIGGLFGIA